VPYIKRLENQRDVLVRALKSVEAYNAATDRYNATAYKSDAMKALNVAKKEMQTAINEAKSILGGIYA